MIWGALAVWASVTGAQAGLRARDQIEDVLDTYSSDDIARGEADGDLRRIRDEFETARGDLGGWRLAPVRWLPVVGRQVRSASSLSGAGAEMVDIALELTAEASTLADGLDDETLELVAGLRTLAPPLGQLRDRAAEIELGPDEGLVGPLAEARREASRHHRDLVDNLTRAADGALGMASFLEGPSRFLLFAANTSQMQSGMGGLLSVGVVEVADGEVSVGRVSSVSDLELPTQPVPLDPDYEARWGWLNPNEAWSSLGGTPRFDVTASTAAAMWSATGGGEVDGVLAVDPVAISAVLEATGPVRIDGITYGPRALLDYLAHGQYLELTEDIYENWETFAIAQAERRDHLAAIASQVVTSITSDDVDGLDVVIQLAEAARGRHVMFWSRDEVEQRAWRAAGVSGELEVDSMLLSLVNRSATKADFYLPVRAEISTERFDDRTEVVVEVTVENEIPFGEPRYVAGPHPELDLGYGDHLAVLALNLPGWARNGRVDGDTSLALAGADGPTRVVGSWITVPRDSLDTRTFRFELPPEVTSFTIEPGARYPVTRWRYGNERWNDAGPYTISF